MLLSDRIYVLGERPTSVVAEFTVPLSRPRTLEQLGKPEAVELERALLRALHVHV